MSRTALDGAHSQHHDSLTNANFSTVQVGQAVPDVNKGNVSHTVNRDNEQKHLTYRTKKRGQVHLLTRWDVLVD